MMVIEMNDPVGFEAMQSAEWEVGAYAKKPSLDSICFGFWWFHAIVCIHRVDWTIRNWSHMFVFGSIVIVCVSGFKSEYMGLLSSSSCGQTAGDCYAGCTWWIWCLVGFALCKCEGYETIFDEEVVTSVRWVWKVVSKIYKGTTSTINNKIQNSLKYKTNETWKTKVLFSIFFSFTFTFTFAFSSLLICKHRWRDR